MSGNRLESWEQRLSHAFFSLTDPERVDDFFSLFSFLLIGKEEW